MAMAAKFRRHTIMLIAGQRAERQHEEKMRAKEAEVMRTQLRSLSRLRQVLKVQHAPLLGRQKRWTQILHDDAHDHNVNLRMATSGYYRRQDKHNTRLLRRFIRNYDFYKAQVHAFQQQRELLNKEISNVERDTRCTLRKITQRKLECDKCRVPRPEKVETRLELVCTEFGKLLEMNRALMDEIHHLTQERTLVIKIFNGLQLRLAKLSKELSVHIDVASEMYNQQDSAKRAMVKLHEHYEKSAATFEGQMNNFECGIDAFKRIEKFMTQKNKHRPDDGRERRRQLRDQLTATEKENLMYQSVVQQIRTVLGDEELNEIVDTFIELVEENYMLFINVAEYRDRVRNAQTEIEKTREEIAKHRSQSVQEVKANRLLRAELVEKTAFCKKAAEDIEKKIEHADSIIQSYITGVLIILYNLDYTDSEIKELAGVLGKVEERNVLRFLGEIEEYANKLWGIQNYVEYTAYHKRKADSPIAEAILPNQPRVRLVPREAVVAPAAYDEDDEDHLPLEADRRPFSWEEIFPFVLSDVETKEALAYKEELHEERGTVTDGVSDLTGTHDDDDSHVSSRPAHKDVF